VFSNIKACFPILTIVILNKKLKRTEIYYTVFILRAVIAKNQAGQIMTLSDSQVL
jgi:hypothetical protein